MRLPRDPIVLVTKEEDEGDPVLCLSVTQMQDLSACYKQAIHYTEKFRFWKQNVRYNSYILNNLMNKYKQMEPLGGKVIDSSEMYLICMAHHFHRKCILNLGEHLCVS